MILGTGVEGKERSGGSVPPVKLNTVVNAPRAERYRLILVSFSLAPCDVPHTPLHVARIPRVHKSSQHTPDSHGF